MARKFAEIAFTPSANAAQRLEGAHRGSDKIGRTRNRIIAVREGFYQAKVSETYWPYVQYRRGPAGFLKVLDERTIAFADFLGNVQYLSAGNLATSGRIAMILMDYPNRRPSTNSELTSLDIRAQLAAKHG